MPTPIVTPVPLVPSTVTAKLYLGSSEYVKNALVYCLALAFNHPYTPAEYHYDMSDPTKCQISLSRGFPKKVVIYPTIIVETKVGDASITSLGNEEGVDVEDNSGNITGRTHWGTINMPTVVTVATDGAVDRERLGDLTYIYFRSIFKDLFNRERMPFLDIQAGADGEIELNGKLRYIYTISLKIQTEFNYFIDQSMLNLFGGVNLSGILFDAQGDNNPHSDTVS